MKETISYFTLSELAGIVDDLIKDAFYEQSFWVIAETSDVKNYSDRAYCFLSLIEKDGRETLAKMEAVVWSRYYHILTDFELSTGISFDKNLKILVKVSIDFSPKYGLKLQILDIDPSYTAGEMEREKKATLERLLRQNPSVIHFVDGEFVSQNKELDRPLVFQTLALITAPDSDGRRDFLHELQSNPYGYNFRCDEYLTRIQGDGAENLILGQLKNIFRSKTKYDVIVIVRGGGSQLDFGPFDTYDLGLGIASSKIPVITGIGHERNVSIADMMSHLMVKTPTKAASFIIDHNRNFEEEIIRICEDILNSTLEIIDASKNSLDRLSDRLTASCKYLFVKKQNDLEKIEIALKHLDPENVLARGYAMVLKNNKIIVDPSNISVGDSIDIRLKEEFITTLVQQKSTRNEN